MLTITLGALGKYHSKQHLSTSENINTECEIEDLLKIYLKYSIQSQSTSACDYSSLHPLVR